MIKKLSSIIIISTFIFALIGFVPVMAEESTTTNAVENNGVKANAGEKLEKIPSLDQIRYYKNIIKKDSALYGIRKEKLVEKKEAIASGTEKKLEKIANPQAMGFYEKIRKIGNSLWGFLKGEKKKEEKRRVVTSETSACVISAIEKKDASLIKSNSAFTEKLNVAIAARTVCQKTALGSVEKQAANIEACIKTFKTADKGLRIEVKKEYESAWKTYKEDLAVCSKTVSASTTSEQKSEIMVEDGAVSIVDSVK